MKSRILKKDGLGVYADVGSLADKMRHEAGGVAGDAAGVFAQTDAGGFCSDHP